jgi:hypothetical protein
LPDAWETRYGFATNNPADGLLDPDNDRMNNRAEYLAGTDPTNAVSLLRIDGFGWPPAFEFTAVSNVSYTIECRDALGPGPWQPWLNFPAQPTNRVVPVVDPAPPGQGRFYRIRTPMAPYW